MTGPPSSAVLVVGAGTRPAPDGAPVGIGRAIAVVLARSGAHVICVDRNGDAAAGTVALIESEGHSAEVVEADVTTDDGVGAVCGSVAGRTLHGVVLNVGVARGAGLASTARDWDLSFSANIRGPALVLGGVLEQVRDGGAIAFVGSLAGRKAITGSPPYETTKAGVEALCRHTAIEGGPRGIRANVVAPGLIDTPLGRLATEKRPDRAGTTIPLRRHGTAWEVADAVAFLMSDHASYVTGQVLYVDGGLSAT